MIRILIIDDDKLIRWSLTEIFAQEGHAVATAATADEALLLTERNYYHMIFADLDIQNVSGVDMLKKIQKAHPETHIVILSAQNRKDIEVQIKDLTISSILEKPFTSQEIRDIAKEVLDLIHRTDKASVPNKEV